MASNSGFRSSLMSERHVPVGSSSSSRSIGNSQYSHSSVRSKVPISRRSVILNSRTHSNDNDGEDSGRVRVAVRLRPRNAQDLVSDADFADFVEVQPELKRLKLRKNNWSSESFRFDEVFTETASQRRVYEVVAKPVVESVLNGYNGTVMAYGQTGTGKTYTVGRLGKEDASERGIMVRAVEDIITNTSPASDCVEVSYLQLYMESIQDLLAPGKINIPIIDDPKTGEVSAPGAAIIKLRDLDHFLRLLQIGEANRHAANTKLNTESSRSHAILMVYVRRSFNEKSEDEVSSQENNSLAGGNRIPTVRKSKLLIVDLAGSERIDKSGSEGHSLEEAKFINLSLTSLGKCINALAENSPHIPIRDSKLTRLLRDSFGGSARTSLIISIGPSARHHAETTSTIMFGQRAMKVINMVKLKEEFDYESLCRKLENQVDHLTADIERQKKFRENDKDELEKKLRECENCFAETEKGLVTRSEFLEKENVRLEMEMKDILNELNRLKNDNNLMHDKVAHLELSLKDSKFLEKENARLEMKMKDILNELNRQQNDNNLMHDEVAHLEMSLKDSKFLEKENVRLEMEMKDILNELNRRKNDNNLMHDEVAHLEMSLKDSKQRQLENSTYQKVLADTTKMNEKKIAELTNEVEDERARSEFAEEQVDVMKKHLNDHQKSIQQHQLENSSYQKELADTTQMYEKKIAELTKEVEDERARSEIAEEQVDVMKKHLNDQQHQLENSSYQKVLADTTQMYEKKIAELTKEVEDERARSEIAEEQVDVMKKHLNDQQYKKEVSTYQTALADTTQMYEKKVAELIKQLEDEHVRSESAEDLAKKLSTDYRNSMQGKKEIDELMLKLQEMNKLYETTVNELQALKLKYKGLLSEKEMLYEELHAVRQKQLVEETQRKTIENELVKLYVPESDNDVVDKRSYVKDSVGKVSASFGTTKGSHKSSQSREILFSKRATIAKICEEVGLHKILALLASEDPDVQIHAVKVVANLAAEDINQEKIVEEGGVDALLMLLRSSENTTILRVASGAIANLAMNEMNQGLIMSKGGSQLLAKTASKTDDPQTLRMVAGAIANLCGNEKLHMMLIEDRAIKALLGMVRTGNSDIIAQVARGLANFAKCESRGVIQGRRKGRSLLMEDGALSWLIANSNITSTSTRRHVELALCHLAQNEDNAQDFISSGGLEELHRISTESSGDDIRNLAKKTLKLNPNVSTMTISI